MTPQDDERVASWHESLATRAQGVRDAVDALEASAAAAGMTVDLDRARRCLDNYGRQLKDDAAVSVALIGGTGSGKSTLLNALVGARLVPTSSMRACTSVITRVAWASGPAFAAEVRFVTPESWREQWAAVASDIRATHAPDTDGITSGGVISRDDRYRLQAVYGDELTDRFLADGDLVHLKMPPELAAVVERGIEHISSTDLESFRLEIKRYLDSSESLWPLVESVRITGPFEVLANGGEIVDLPGLNDPNDAREATTRRFLSEVRFVWVVFNLKRNLTREVTETLRSRDLLRQLVAGGRLSSVTLVGTASDDIDPDADCEELGLPSDSDDATIIDARNRATKEIARSSLQGLVEDLRRDFDSSGASRELDDIANALAQSPVYTVSARDFLIGMRVIRGRNIIEELTVTQVPALRKHLEAITLHAGPWARATRALDSLSLAVAELTQSVSELRSEHEVALLAREAERQELADALGGAAENLDSRIRDVHARLRRHLHRASAAFSTSLKESVEPARRRLVPIAAEWDRYHWATLRAAAARGGRYVSPAAGTVDLIDDAASPLLSATIAPWTHFFDVAAPPLMEDLRDDLEHLLAEFSVEVAAATDRLDDTPPEVTVELERLTGDISVVVAQSVAQTTQTVSAMLDEERKQLHRVTRERLASALGPGLVAASREQGPGMKERMLALATGLVARAGVAEYDEIATTLETSVTKLVDSIDAAFLDLALAVVERVRDVAERVPGVSDQSADLHAGWLVPMESALAAVRASVASSLEPPPPRLDDARSAPRPDPPTPEPHGATAAPPAGATELGRTALLVLDGSNIASSPGSGPSLARLESCVAAAQQAFPEYQVITVVDRTLLWAFREEAREDPAKVAQVERFEELLAAGRLIEPPPGHPGKADSFILDLTKEQGGSVLSNDSFKEFQDEHPWLFDRGQLVGFTFHPAFGWRFSPRFPVRRRWQPEGPTSQGPG